MLVDCKSKDEIQPFYYLSFPLSCFFQLLPSCGLFFLKEFFSLSKYSNKQKIQVSLFKLSNSRLINCGSCITPAYINETSDLVMLNKAVPSFVHRICSTTRVSISVGMFKVARTSERMNLRKSI